jgi:glycosyltransferase involved in cell wall biosynthesis
VVVNDGSTDDTAQVVREFSRKDARIRLLEHKRNRGAQAARNTGIRAARGEWIAFLDSDDQWLPSSLEARLRLALGKGLAVVYSDCYVWHPQAVRREPFRITPLAGNVYKELLRDQGPMFQGLLVAKSALAHIHYLDESISAYQEWDTVIRLARHYRFAFLAEPTFVYDCRHSPTISKDSLRSARGYEQVIKKHWWPILRHVGPKALACHYYNAAGYYRKAKQRRKVRICLLTASLLWPFSAQTMELLGNAVGEGPHREVWRWCRRRFEWLLARCGNFFSQG